MEWYSAWVILNTLCFPVSSLCDLSAWWQVLAWNRPAVCLRFACTQISVVSKTSFSQTHSKSVTVGPSWTTLSFLGWSHCFLSSLSLVPAMLFSYFPTPSPPTLEGFASFFHPRTSPHAPYASAKASLLPLLSPPNFPFYFPTSHLFRVIFPFT